MKKTLLFDPELSITSEDELLLQYVSSRCVHDKAIAGAILFDLVHSARELGATREQWLETCALAWDWDPEKDLLPS
jgi:hypothetical protein